MLNLILYFLVQRPDTVKITDFGLAKLLDYDAEEYKSTGGKVRRGSQKRRGSICVKVLLHHDMSFKYMDSFNYTMYVQCLIKIL